jgi:hypothetical protein
MMERFFFLLPTLISVFQFSLYFLLHLLIADSTYMPAELVNFFWWLEGALEGRQQTMIDNSIRSMMVSRNISQKKEDRTH